MSRKSTAALAVVTPGMRRPEPQEGLTPAEASVWRSTVNTKPSDWFLRDTFPLLAMYCRTSVAAEIIAQQINAFNPEWMATAEGLARYNTLLAMQYRQGVLLTSLATKMRLAQQSRYGARQSDTAARLGAAGSQTWQPGSA